MALRILLLCTACNGLTQLVSCRLSELGHDVVIQVASDPETMQQAAQRERPDLIVAPMLKSAIPEAVWNRTTCLIVHPGIVGDRGPSSLDWAILEGEREWGVTVLQAAAEMDAGDIWASANFPMREIGKSELYRHEVAQAAMRALLQAIERYASGLHTPRSLDYRDADVRGRLRPSMRAADRAVDWDLPSATILRRVRCGDSAPGARALLAGLPCQLYDAWPEATLRGRPGELLAQREGAVCVGSGDGALWLGHLRAKEGIKLPAAQVLGRRRMSKVPERPIEIDAADGPDTWRDIRYREDGEVGYLHFDFYNGAMSTRQCERLRAAYLHARQRPTKVIALMGGRDVWSNGIHLNQIEAASDPALESWRNILAMNALVREIVLTDSHRVVAAMQGNAGAGGVVLALAADQVWARGGLVLNPHYQGMGGLYGSEYWTYLMPRRVGAARALELTESLRPLTSEHAARIGLIDAAFGEDGAGFRSEVEARARVLAEPEAWRKAMGLKRRRRNGDERRKPLESYAAEELSHMYRNFFGPDPAYHDARRRFVRKGAPAPASEPAHDTRDSRETASPA